MPEEVADVCMRKYAPVTDEQKAMADDVKRLGNDLIDAINKSGRSRMRSVGVTHIEIGVMAAVKGIFNE